MFMFHSYGSVVQHINCKSFISPFGSNKDDGTDVYVSYGSVRHINCKSFITF